VRAELVLVDQQYCSKAYRLIFGQSTATQPSCSIRDETNIFNCRLQHLSQLLAVFLQQLKDDPSESTFSRSCKPTSSNSQLSPSSNIYSFFASPKLLDNLHTTQSSQIFATHSAMSFNEKPTVGAEIRKPTPTATSHPQLTVERANEDTTFSHTLTPVASQCPTPNEEYDPATSHPFSAFYCHPTTRTSFEQLRYECKTRVQVYETDLEAAQSRKSLDPLRKTKECSVRPGRRTLKEKSLLTCDGKRWNPMRKLNKRQKLWAKILIALVIVGAAVGIGVGISKAVGGGVWKSANEQTQIGTSNR